MERSGGVSVSWPIDSMPGARHPARAFWGLGKNCGILGLIAAATLFCVLGRSAHAEDRAVQLSRDAYSEQHRTAGRAGLSQPAGEEQIPQRSPHDSGDPERSVAIELELLKQRIEELEAAKVGHEEATRMLNQRIKELEAAKVAHEEATRVLNQRLEELEAPKIAHEGATIAGKDATHEDAPVMPDQRLEGLEVPKVTQEAATIAGKDAAHEDATRTLDQRVEELEKAKVVHEDATRTIIRQSFAEMGSNINEYVAFGGTLETLTFRTEDFAGVRESNILLDTAEIDFEIQASDWVLGSLVFQYDQGTDVLFPTTEGDESGVDRVNVRQAWLTIGNTQSFPLFGTFGRDVVPFGISTGDPVVDVLTLIDPLTVEAFETREDFIMLGFEGPTPPPTPPLPATPGLGPPPVRPLLLKPLVRKVGTWLCSSVPCYLPRPKPVAAATPPTPRPPFSGSVYFYNGDTFDGGGNHIEHVGGTLGYRTKGMFSRRRIPWSIDIDGDVNSSVFDSDFLAFEYRGFLDQIGYVPGMAAHVKSNLGPTALVLEWNGAIDKARFTDDLGRAFSIRPGGWQVQLAYQFDFNPSVEAIGAQGTYVVMGYSESEDLAGVRRLIADTPTRVGFVPRRRLSVGVGEWVLDSLRIAVEYSHSVDYSIAEGGTGNSADGMFTQLTYQW